MLYYLLPDLAPFVGVLNVTRYITFRTAAASLTALAISLLLGPWMIAKLRAFQIGQVIRQEGPQSHRAKAGTPTMGGLLILAAAIGPTLLWADLANFYIWVAVLATCAFGAVGFADDYLKIARRSHHGLRPRYKLGLQVLVAVGVGLALMALADNDLYNTRLIFPFFKNLIPDLGWFYVAFAVLVLVGATNAVNLTDGLDGLAISTFGVAAAAYTALAYVTGHAVLADYLLLVRFAPAGELTVFCGALVGASLGFLWYKLVPRRSLHGRCWLAGSWRRARYRGHPHQAGVTAADCRRCLRHRSALGDCSGGVLQAQGPPRVQDGAPPPPLRAQWVERAQGQHAFSDPGGDFCALQPDDVEAAVMVWVTVNSPFTNVAWWSSARLGAASQRPNNSRSGARS